MLRPELQKTALKLLSRDVSKESFPKFSPADWDTLFSFFKKQNLSVLVSTILRENNIDVPSDLADEMKDIYLSACSQDFKRQQQIKEIIEIFNKNNIEHILLKGAHLVNTLYEKPFTRLTTDIDILVKAQNSMEANRVLIRNGYENFLLPDDKCLKSIEHFTQHYPPLYKEGFIAVELHTYISQIYHSNLDRIWEEAKQIEVGGLKTKVMCNEDLLIHISMHKFFEDGAVNGLLGLYDISRIINTGQIDWNKLEKLSRQNEYNNARCLYIVTSLCKTLLNANVDQQFIDSIRPESNKTDEIETNLRELLFNDFMDFDKASFVYGENIYSEQRKHSKIFNYIFLSPYRMRLYGYKKYNKKYMGFWGLSNLYIKRFFSLFKNYTGVYFKPKLSKENKADNTSRQLGEKTAGLRQWLKDS